MSASQTLINLCASMGIADNMSDVADYVWEALEQIGIKPPEDVSDLSELMKWLGKTHHATTVYGTSVTDEPDI